MNIRKINLARAAMMLIVGCVVGFLLLTAVFCIPVSGVRDAQQTADLFRQEGNRPSVIPSYRASTGDNYTDALMIAEAIFDDPQISPVEKAVHVYRRANSDSATVDLADMLEGKDMQWVIPYSRYWHGFLVLLRPLLLLFSYADIRMMLCAAQMMIYAAILVSFVQKNKAELIVPFFAVMMTLSPMGTMISMQYFASFAIMALGMLIIVHGDAWLSRDARYFYLFLLLGMLTAYFDFLTYPLVTLFIPLVLAVYHHLNEKDLLLFAVAACASWGVGYLGFWALKWLVGSLLVGEDLIYKALNHARYQVSMADVDSGNRLQALTENLGVICHLPYLLLYLGSACVCAVQTVRRKCRLQALLAGGRPLLLLFALAPFVWWCVAVSHSCVHDLFTYRLLTIPVFSLLSWIVSAPKIKEMK